MGEALYILIGVAASGLVLFLSKMFGGKKGKVVAAHDTDRASAAADRASELLGRRAMIEAESEEAKKRVEEKLAIEDSVERLEALAEELKDL